LNDIRPLWKEAKMFCQNSASRPGSTHRDTAHSQNLRSKRTRSHHLRKCDAIHSVVAEELESRVHLSYDDRGKISVIVDATIASDLTAELAQYKQDLIGDGWTVSMHTDAPRMNDNQNVWNNGVNPAVKVPSTTTQYRADLQTVKDLIAADDAVTTDVLKAIVIVGHVTVPYSGLTDYDGHVTQTGGPGRAMPTDQYYADLDGTPASWRDTSANYGPSRHRLPLPVLPKCLV
jgi:hypothetical protein